MHHKTYCGTEIEQVDNKPATTMWPGPMPRPWPGAGSWPRPRPRSRSGSWPWLFSPWRGRLRIPDRRKNLLDENGDWCNNNQTTGFPKMLSAEYKTNHPNPNLKDKKRERNLQQRNWYWFIMKLIKSLNHPDLFNLGFPNN